MELLSLQLCEIRDMSPNVKDKLLRLAPPTALKIGTIPSGLLRFRSQHIPYLSFLDFSSVHHTKLEHRRLKKEMNL